MSLGEAGGGCGSPRLRHADSDTVTPMGHGPSGHMAALHGARLGGALGGGA